ncbi:restriction endonuclease subunit S [Enterococcus hirae]|uniref:restriction endonuclease subunit S n=1 Tax=Enterococcus hirae TaxID=1354 RepID=UPI001962E5A8|nr:restriction endonuclease subunit S [Enterococcus hirae]
MSNDTQPEIRFPEFTDEWEQRKLGDVVLVMDGDRGKNYPSSGDFYEKEHTLFLSAANITKNGFSFDINQYITEEKSNSMGNGKLEANDIVLTSRGSLGHIAWYDKDIKEKVPFARINSGMLILRSNDKFEASFIAQYLKSPLGKCQIDLISFGSAQPQLTKKDVLKYKISLPNKDEKMKLGIFFTNLDKIIALHQRKLDLLKETKKGFLQKMFPKNGAKVPEIRFPGFTEDWEQRKFGEIVQVSRGLTYKPSDVQIEGIRVLRSSNINEDVFVLRDDDVFVKPDAVNIAPIKNGDILITSANGSSRLVGKHAIVNGLQDKTVHGGFMLRVKSKNTWFTNSLMSSRWYNYFINIYVSGGNGAIGNLRKYDLESQTIIVPDDEEQQKIGAFFKQLDDTITLHQRKLDLLKETKKGFLQKMFV